MQKTTDDLKLKELLFLLKKLESHEIQDVLEVIKLGELYDASA